MFELIPYGRTRNLSWYNPFLDPDELERRAFDGSALSAFKTDIRDMGESYLLEADLPGFAKENVHVDVEGDTLTIRAERKLEKEEKDEKRKFVKQERSYGSFSRSFDMTGIDTEGISAAYENGVLRLTLPKRKETLPASRRLEIQ